MLELEMTWTWACYPEYSVKGFRSAPRSIAAFVTSWTMVALAVFVRAASKTVWTRQVVSQRYLEQIKCSNPYRPGEMQMDVTLSRSLTPLLGDVPASVGHPNRRWAWESSRSSMIRSWKATLPLEVKVKVLSLCATPKFQALSALKEFQYWIKLISTLLKFKASTSKQTDSQRPTRCQELRRISRFWSARFYSRSLLWQLNFSFWLLLIAPTLQEEDSF